VKISIVVATLGRESLEVCLKSWLVQSYPVWEIVVVADGPEAEINTREIVSRCYFGAVRVRVLANSSNLGVSTSFNLGMKLATGELIALTSDDDPWLPDKLLIQVQEMQKNNLDIVLTGAYYRRGRRWIKRPRIQLTSSESPLIQVLRHYTFPWTASRYIPMSSILFRSTVSKIEFNASLMGYEDFLWLHQAFTQGYKISQCSEPLIWINANMNHALRRKDAVLNSQFMEKLKEIDGELVTRFVASHLSRSVIFSGDTKKFQELHKIAFADNRQNLFDLAEYSWQITITFIMFVFKNIKRQKEKS